MKIHKILLPFRKYHFPVLEKIEESQREFIIRVNSDILQKKYRISLHKCLCGGEDFDLLASIDHHGFITPVSVCRSCGLVSINPGYSEVFYNDLWNSEKYFEIFYNVADAQEYALANFTPVAGRHIFNSVRRYTSINSKTKVLEVEARAGWNLLPFRQFGTKAIGIERNKELALWGRKMGFEIINTDINNFDTSDRFNVIIFSDMLNKVNNPIEYIIKILELLDDKGVVFIDVPLYSPEKIDFCLNSQYYFTKETFRYFFTEVNLIPLEIRAFNNHISGVFRKGAYTSNKELLERNRKNTYKAINRIKLIDYLTFSKRIKSDKDVEVLKLFKE